MSRLTGGLPSSTGRRYLPPTNLSIFPNTSVLSYVPLKVSAPGPLAESGTSEAVWPLMDRASAAVSVSGGHCRDGQPVAPFSKLPVTRNPRMRRPPLTLSS